MVDYLQIKLVVSEEWLSCLIGMALVKSNGTQGESSRLMANLVYKQLPRYAESPERDHKITLPTLSSYCRWRSSVVEVVT